MLTFIGTLIPMAEKMVDGYCNHSFGTPTIGTWLFDGNGKSTLFLPPTYYPMIGISAGSVDSSAITANLKVYDQYLKLTTGNFISGEKNVTIYGSYGYTSIPKDVEYVTAQITSNVLANMVKQNVVPDLMVAMVGNNTQGAGGINQLFAAPNVFPETLRQLLEPYRVNWVDIGGK